MSRPLPSGFAAAAFLAFLVLVSCGDDPSAPRVDAPDGVGPEGGVVGSQDGRAKLVVPEGALTERVEIELILANPPVADAELIAESAYLLRPEATTFGVPAVLTIEYDPALVPDSVAESSLRILRSVPQGWNDSLVTHVETDAGLNTVRATVEAGGVYAVFATFAEPDTGSAAAYIVDPPLSGSVRYFTEVAPAVAYVCTLPADTVPHRIVVRTSRALRVGTLAFGCDVRLEVDPGHTPSLAAPVDSVMLIEAQGALVLSNLTIDAPLGLLIRAARRFEVDHNTITGPTTIEVVPAVAGAIGRAGASSSSAWTGGGTVSGNTVEGPLALSYNANVGGNLEYAVAENSAPEASVSTAGGAAFGAHLELEANLVDGLTLDLDMDAGASAAVRGHAGVDVVDADLRPEGAIDFDFESNAVADGKFKLAGVGSATARFASNDLTSGEFSFGLTDLEFESTGDVMGDIAVGLIADAITAPKASWQQTGGSIDHLDLFSTGVTSPDAALAFRLTSGTSVTGPVSGDLTVGTTFYAGPDVKLSGDFGMKVTGRPLDVELDHANLEGRVTMQTVGGLEASLRAEANGVRFEQGGVIAADGAAFLSVTLLEFGGGAGTRIGRGTPNPAGGLTPTSSMAAAGADTIVITDANITVTGNNGINIENVNGLVHIDGGAISSDLGAIWIGNASGEVLIENLSLTGAGMSVDSSDAHVLVRNIDLVQSGVLGFSATGSSDVTVEDFVATASGVLTFGAAEIDSDITYRNSSFIGHMYPVNGTGGVLRLENSTFSGTFGGMGDGGHLIATNSTFIVSLISFETGYGSFVSGNSLTGMIGDLAWGGLVMDPVGPNPGISDDEVMTIVDFDGNGCADHPAAFNQKENGICGLDGQPPRSVP